MDCESELCLVAGTASRCGDKGIESLVYGRLMEFTDLMVSALGETVCICNDGR